MDGRAVTAAHGGRLAPQSGNDHAILLPRGWAGAGRDSVAVGKPILSAEQIEDVVAYLATLRD